MFKGEKALCLLRLIWILIIYHAKQQLEFQIGMNNILYKTLYSAFGAFLYKKCLACK